MDLFIRIRLPGSKIQGNLLDHSEALHMVGIQVGKEQIINPLNPGAIQLLCDFSRRIDQKVLTMDKGRRPRPFVRNALSSGLLTHMTMT